MNAFMRTLLGLTLIFSGHSQADEKSESGWISDAELKEISESVNEWEEVIRFNEKLAKDDVGYSKLVQTNQCNKQHEHVKTKVRDQRMAELIRSVIANRCNKDSKMAEAHLLLAAQKGSFAAKRTLKILEEDRLQKSTRP